ncbi:hypothetical protein [Photorhabdus sp. SF281]|uniref:hypothetical protein n=1 Tax=Photorhabdus sp. SF281 TaxID=3459527 RepID=UPI00404427BC
MKIEIFKKILADSKCCSFNPKKNKLFYKENMFFNGYLVYFLLMITYGIKNSIFLYIDFIMAIGLLVAIISIIKKTTQEFNLLLIDFNKGNYKNHEIDIKEVTNLHKIISALILIIIIAMLLLSCFYIVSFMNYTFSLLVLLSVFISTSIYLIIKILAK